MQKEIIMKEGKDERVAVRIQKLQRGNNKQRFEDLVDSSNNMKQRERGSSKWKNMHQHKDMLEMDIGELWHIMKK